MANIELVLRYGKHEARTAVPLEISLEEILRRVTLKKSPIPHDEAARWVGEEVRGRIDDHRLITDMLKDILKQL